MARDETGMEILVWMGLLPLALLSLASLLELIITLGGKI